MEYSPEEVEDEGTKDRGRWHPVAAKDIPISLMVQDDPTAIIGAYESKRPVGEHRPIKVKAQVDIHVVPNDGDFHNYEKKVEFTYKAFKVTNLFSTDGTKVRLEEVKGSFTYDSNTYYPTNPTTMTIPAKYDSTTVFIELTPPAVQAGPQPAATFYAAILVKITVGTNEGRDEVFVRFEKPATP